ncbi:MAG TPA: hypothetical protein VGX92_21610 [Pyrinomonadaceae bacterium]|jgi:hypothetical protein|nr:hypothetical protein [Pyrinomonadaceae bacterium]
MANGAEKQNSRRGVAEKRGSWSGRVGRGAIYAALALTAACGGSLYKVSTRVEAPLPPTATTARAGALRVRAVPLLTDEESQQLFEANLLLGGLLPVRVEVENESGAEVVLERARFRLRDGAGREWKARSAKQAVSRILDANGVTFYNPSSRREFQERVSAHALDVARPLAPAERRQGLLFFQTPQKEAVESPRGLVLSIEKLLQPVELRLD